MFLTILTFAVVLIVLVVIHELGHFTAAKIMGIRVEEFGFGIPPRAWGKKIGETLYSLNWLPIGGFVRLYGEDAQHPEKIKKDKSRAFFSKKPWQRSIVLIAGVLMNFILGWFIVAYLYGIGLPVQTNQVKIMEVSESGPAQEVGLEEGDIVTEILTPEHIAIPLTAHQDLVSAIQPYEDTEIMLTVLREGSLKKISITPIKPDQDGNVIVGIVISDTEIVTYTKLTDRLVHGFTYSLFIIKATIDALRDTFVKLFAGQTADIQVGGFILVGQVVGEARKVGTDSLLFVVALLSLNLALINILPFPALDGGRLIFVLYEWVTRRRLKPQWESYVHQIGMLLLLIIMLLITVNDILRLGRG